MQTSKYVLRSKTIWGAVINLTASIILFATIHAADAKYLAIVNGLGALTSIVGRIVAKERLHI